MSCPGRWPLHRPLCHTRRWPKSHRNLYSTQHCTSGPLLLCPQLTESILLSIVRLQRVRQVGMLWVCLYTSMAYPIPTPTQSSGSGSRTLQLGGGICVASSANAFPANVDVVDGAPCSQCCSFSDGPLMHSLQVSGRMDATTTWNGDPKTETAKRRWVDRFHFEHVWFTSRAIGPSTQPH